MEGGHQYPRLFIYLLKEGIGKRGFLISNVGHSYEVEILLHTTKNSLHRATLKRAKLHK